MRHLPVFPLRSAEIGVEALSAMDQRNQALPTALAPKLSLDRNSPRKASTANAVCVSPTDRHQNHPELDGFWDAKEKSARFRN